MKRSRISRRRFLYTTAGAGALVAASASRWSAGDTRWPIGCFNRLWAHWGQKAALQGMRRRGCYRLTGLLSRRPEHPLIGVEATPEKVFASI